MGKGNSFFTIKIDSETHTERTANLKIFPIKFYSAFISRSKIKCISSNQSQNRKNIFSFIFHYLRKVYPSATQFLPIEREGLIPRKRSV